MTTIDINRDRRQDESVEKWRNAGGKGTLNLTMRFGKTRVASKIIDKMFQKNPDYHVLAIAPNDITYKNLFYNLEPDRECKGWIQVKTSHQLINYTQDARLKGELPFKVDLLILDEVHKLLSPEALLAIKSVEYKYILALTGSKLNNKQIEILESLNAPIVDTITECEAIVNKWVAPSLEYNLAVQLDEHDKIRYAKYSESISETLEVFKGLHKQVNQLFKSNVFDSDFNLVLSAFTGIHYKDKNGIKTFIKPTILRNMLADIMGWSRDMPLDNEYNKRIAKYWNPDNIFERAKKFKDFVKQRNEILIHNRPKINAVLEILRYNDVSTICFNESIAMVDDLAEHFPTDGIPYHSNIESRYVINPATGHYYTYKNGNPKYMGKESLKKLAIAGMKSGVYKYLFTAQSLNEGLTIENIEQIITTGGSCNTMTYEQRVARGKTLNIANPEKVCIIINIYIDDFKIGEKEVKSRDKQKLILRQQSSENIPIWVNSVSEIFV